MRPYINTSVIRFCSFPCLSIVVAAVLLGIGSGACQRPIAGQPTPQAADLVLVNARVWTGANDVRYTPGINTDESRTGVAIRGGRIVAVGPDDRIRTYIDANTDVLDVRGRRVIPGITDSHIHIVSGGFQLARLNLRQVRGRAEFIHAVAQEVKPTLKLEWVLGGRWSVESWDYPESPNKRWIDPVTGDVPVFLSRMDGHQALVNSAALRLAGIDTSGPPDPKGGEIVRDPDTGEPTGILKESAMDLVRRQIPDATASQRYAALGRAMKHANSLGVTSVHDMCSRADLDTFRRAEREGTLTVRITAYLSVDDWASYAKRFPAYGLNSDMVRLVGLKGFMDGSLGSRTAYMREPYADAAPGAPYPRGQLTAMADPPESFQQRVAMADARGMQLAVHAIGDQANHQLLNAYEGAASRGLGFALASDAAEHNTRRGAHHRVEHAQHLHTTDIPRFAQLGVVASMQPFHKSDDGRYAEKALGAERLNGSYAFRQLVATGALVIFGSDWPVVNMNPFMGIDAAVNAKTLDGKVWLPSHSLTVEEAIRAYTVLPPRAVQRDDRLGTIEVGKYADLVILSEDPFTIPKERVGEITVDQTIVAGKIVYTRTN